MVLKDGDLVTIKNLSTKECFDGKILIEYGCVHVLHNITHLDDGDDSVKPYDCCTFLFYEDDSDHYLNNEIIQIDGEYAIINKREPTEFYCKTLEESHFIQKILFSKGYTWRHQHELKNYTGCSICAHSDKTLTYSFYSDSPKYQVKDLMKQQQQAVNIWF